MCHTKWVQKNDVGIDKLVDQMICDHTIKSESGRGGIKKVLEITHK